MIVADPQWAEAALAAGELPCPHCGGVLRAWAYARERRIRGLPDPVRPRRALCAACRRSHRGRERCNRPAPRAISKHRGKR